MALRGKVVDLVGLHFLHDPDQVGAVGQVAVMQVETLVIDVRILVDILDPTGVEARAAALHAVDFVALLTWLLAQPWKPTAENSNRKWSNFRVAEHCFAHLRG